MIRNLIVCPILTEGIVCTQSWDRFSCQTVDDLIINDMYGCPFDKKVGFDGGLRLTCHLYVPNSSDLKCIVMDEDLCYKLTIHPGGNKMYHDLCRVSGGQG